MSAAPRPNNHLNLYTNTTIGSSINVDDEVFHVYLPHLQWKFRLCEIALIYLLYSTESNINMPSCTSFLISWYFVLQ